MLRSAQLEMPLDAGTESEPRWQAFPKTRFLGSKRKLLGFLVTVFAELDFDAALDPFCGTGSVAYLLKVMGKSVTATDYLESNVTLARALVQNNSVRLGAKIDALLKGLPRGDASAGFVEQTFDGIFFERRENRFIDQVLRRIGRLEGAQRDLALFALFQACLVKRPFNLFHRANLALRRADVKRTFGNKVTWETPFEHLMPKFAAEADRAVFSSEHPCYAFVSDALESDFGGVDLVYLDPPYVAANRAGVDYLDYYHFLEGLCCPDDWSDRIVHRYKHKPLIGRGASPWCDADRIVGAFEALVARAETATVVLSYRSDGIPSVDDLVRIVGRIKKRVRVVDAGQYVYALSRNRKSREIAIIGE